MKRDTLQEILASVKRPSRYLGTEANRVCKDPKTVRLYFALAFPDLYEIGTSHFGMQILYHRLNRLKGVAAERVFAPDLDFSRQIRAKKIPLISLESKKPIRDFDIIGFSLLYEMNYTNILYMLDLARIPFRSTERCKNDPLIIAGGPCTCNPEPVAEFFDAIVVGDGETVVQKIATLAMEYKNRDGLDKKALLKALDSISGVYIPSFYEPRYNKELFCGIQRKYGSSKRVQRIIEPDLESLGLCINPVVPFGKPVHDRLRIEISRGCTRGCRFCQAGIIYRPVRERSCGNLVDASKRAIKETGYEDLSLLSLSTGDYSCINELVEIMTSHPEFRQTAISFPSLRAGTLTEEMIRAVKKVRKTGFTLAPEAGSQRLRNVINKQITEQDILSTVQKAFDLGWRLIKLYFMIGLPTETTDDLKEIVELVGRIKGVSKNGRLNLSFATFIPKPHTPFQWEPQILLEESREKLKWLKTHLKAKNTKIKWQNPEVSLLEGLFARGDRRLSHLIERAFSLGCLFDGWSDRFRFDLWQRSMEETGVDVSDYIHRKREVEELLPWDHIDINVDKAFLKEQRELAIKGILTGDCRTDGCQGCGACDFEKIMPVIYPNTCQPKEIDRKCETKNRSFKRIRLGFSKTGQAKYFAHLELVEIFSRAIRRANIPVAFTQGFHPKLKISFDDALPVGVESLCESLYMEVGSSFDIRLVREMINKQLPEGLTVLSSELVGKQRPPGKKSVLYSIKSRGPAFDFDMLEAFVEQESHFICLKNKKGKERRIDLKEIISFIKLEKDNFLILELFSSQKITLRPKEVLKEVFNISEDQICCFNIRKESVVHHLLDADQ